MEENTTWRISYFYSLQITQIGETYRCLLMNTMLIHTKAPISNYKVREEGGVQSLNFSIWGVQPNLKPQSPARDVNEAKLHNNNGVLGK